MQMITIRIIFPIAHLRNSQYSYLWGLRKDLRMPDMQLGGAGTADDVLLTGRAGRLEVSP